MRYLLDTNILILHLQESTFLALGMKERFFVSVISEMEFLQFAGIANEEIKNFELLLSICEIIPVSRSIARRAALLARTRKTGIADLLIASTALEYDLVLWTQNVRDFRKIPGLKMRK